MEKYQGVKFRNQCTKSSFDYDHRLVHLNRWAFLFGQLGLAPIYMDGPVVGAYGNHSYRTGAKSFIITKSAMTPVEILLPENFCHIVGYDQHSSTFFTEGESLPSSESFLHNALYQTLPHINAILHGHCSLLISHADVLKIPVTRQFHDYGTQELAQAAVDLVSPTTHFFILKGHGFVALGEDIDSAGRLTLRFYSELLRLLQNL